MAALDRKSGISISEFWAWLTGVRDMQEKDWVPNKEQWKKILSKIESIQEQGNVPFNQPFNVQPSHYNQIQHPSETINIVDRVPTALAELNSDIQSTDNGSYVPQFI